MSDFYTNVIFVKTAMLTCHTFTLYMAIHINIIEQQLLRQLQCFPHGYKLTKVKVS